MVGILKTFFQDISDTCPLLFSQYNRDVPHLHSVDWSNATSQYNWPVIYNIIPRATECRQHHTPLPRPVPCARDGSIPTGGGPVRQVIIHLQIGRNARQVDKAS